MVLVDSSVWIQYLGPQNSGVEARLETLIQPTHQALITGVIFQEVLQGIRNPRSYELTKKLLGRLPFLIPSHVTHAKASEIFLLLTRRVSSLPIEGLGRSVSFRLDEPTGSSRF